MKYIFRIWALRYIIIMAVILGTLIIGLANANLNSFRDNERWGFPAHAQK